MLRLLDLFSGIGGFSLGMEELKKQIEIDVNHARQYIQETHVGIKEGNPC